MSGARDVGVIVVAAGRGTRIGSELPKQYQLVGGVPMVLRALRPFVSHPDVARVALVLPPEDVADPPAFLVEMAGGSLVRSPEAAAQAAAFVPELVDGPLVLVAGGAERSDSVAAGLAALGAECAVVLVHDAARPFVERSVIDEVIRCARAGVSALAAVPLSDTLKEASAEDPKRVARTVPRERLWRAQTPQGFPRAVLERAHAAARRDGRSATDDAALVEALGEPVWLVPDSSRNLKVTTPEDLALAELLAERER